MSSYDPIYLRALSRALSGRSRFTRGGYDGIVATGDLATTGDARDLAVARAFFDGVPMPGFAGSLADRPHKFDPEKLAILPGNHDRYAGTWLTPTSTQFESGSHFTPDWTLRPPGSHSDDRAHVNTAFFPVREGVRLAVVSADFSYRGFPAFPAGVWRYLGSGVALSSTLAEMSTATKLLVEDGVAVIWAMHYPPSIQEGDKFLRIENPDDIARSAVRAGVNLILCGHTHRPRVDQLTIGGGRFTGIRVVNAGTATGAGEGERSYYDILIPVSKSKARIKIEQVRSIKMIYSRWANRLQYAGEYGRSAEFCPAP